MSLATNSEAFSLVGNGKAIVRIIIAKLKAVTDLAMSCPLSFIGPCYLHLLGSD